MLRSTEADLPRAQNAEGALVASPPVRGNGPAPVGSVDPWPAGDAVDLRSSTRASLCAWALGAVLLNACAGALSPAPPKVYRIGYLAGTSLAETTASIEPLRRALRDLGYVEGRNLSLEIRAAEGSVERSPALAAELVAMNVDVILVRGVPQALALKKATSTIPIVAVAIRDPVENGLVASIARPGRNITGLTSTGAETTPRRLQLLQEVVPGAVRVAWLFEPSNPASVRGYEEGRGAAAALGIELLPVEARVPEALAGSLEAAVRGHPDAIYVNVSALTLGQRARILDFLAANHLPATTTTSRTFVDGGALMYYEADEVEVFKRAASYVDRILKGANPADLPIEMPSKYELIINMKTAKALGLTIPPSVLAQATELIQ